MFETVEIKAAPRTHPLLSKWANEPPLAEEHAADGKSFVNPAREGLSETYDKFPAPIIQHNAGWDVHVYYLQTSPGQVEHASALREAIRREWPELRVYKMWDKPIGPHPVGMFEVNVFAPAQFGALVPWLAFKRGPLSVLVHPNSDDEKKDHLETRFWLGPEYPLWTDLFDMIPK